MNVNDCNPYIRFAGNIHISTSTPLSTSLDHRLFYITDGEGYMIINGNRYSLVKGSLILFQSGCAYKISSNDAINAVAINFDYTQMHNSISDPLPPLDSQLCDEQLLLEKCNFEDSPLQNQELYINDFPIIYNDLCRIVEEMQLRKPLFREYASCLMKKIICKIVRSFALNVSFNGPQLQKIFSYIHEHYSQRLTNKMLAAQIGYHPYYINRLMTTYTGTTLHQYLINYRLIIAAAHLLDSNDSIAAISEKVGFQDTAYFSFCFKKMYKISPSLYRKKYLR